ncbi:MAG: DUF1570 domain-containing protein [Planctomycetales bacterium]|nr:DUF1570 domain-containing protein [Planctomycetales bacterium]
MIQSNSIERTAIALFLCLSLMRTGILYAQQGEATSGATQVDSSVIDVEFKHSHGTLNTQAEVKARYADGSLLLLTPDGQLWTVLGEEIFRQSPVANRMNPLGADDIFSQLDPPLGDDFSVLSTRHYVLVFNTSEIYARWVAELFERLHRGFNNYWRSRNVELCEPRFPLVAIVFKDRASYLAYAEPEIGKTAQSMIGYYNLKTNRIVTFDLTGVDGFVPDNRRISSAVVINQILSQPQAERTVATIVHEAVHQLSYNCGLQTRLADNPLWLSEGLAMFFETPDVSNSKGWGAIGKVNLYNYQLFAQYLKRRSSDSLTTLIADDDRFRNAESAKDAYAESWALTYFLMKSRAREFSKYLQEMSQLPPLGEVDARQRLDTFRKYFGDDLASLDREFLNYLKRLQIR